MTIERAARVFDEPAGAHIGVARDVQNSSHLRVSRSGAIETAGASQMEITDDRKWFAVFTLPQNEKSVARQLAMREVEAFLPTYETVKLWKNRQRVRTVLPLFPTYLFVHISHRQRTRVLESPGVVHIVGNSREHIPVPDSTIELLRAGVENRSLQPFRDLAVGKRVRIRNGSMEGVQGILVRQGNGLRFILVLDMINQCAAVEVDAEDLEPILG